MREILLAAEGGPMRFGVPDGTDAPFVVVLPANDDDVVRPPLGQPTVYDIVIGPKGCYLDRRDNATIIPLTDVRCVPFSRSSSQTRGRSRRR